VGRTDRRAAARDGVGAEVVARPAEALGVAMAVTMAQYLSESAGRQSTLLLDDPAAELDAERTDSAASDGRDLGVQLCDFRCRARERGW